MNNGHNPQRVFVRRVGDRVIVLVCEPQGPPGQIGAAVALMRKGHKGFNRQVSLNYYRRRRRRVCFCVHGQHLHRALYRLVQVWDSRWKVRYQGRLQGGYRKRGFPWQHHSPHQDRRHEAHWYHYPRKNKSIERGDDPYRGNVGATRLPAARGRVSVAKTPVRELVGRRLPAPIYPHLSPPKLPPSAPG